MKLKILRTEKVTVKTDGDTKVVIYQKVQNVKRTR